MSSTASDVVAVKGGARPLAADLYSDRLVHAGADRVAHRGASPIVGRETTFDLAAGTETGRLAGRRPRASVVLDRPGRSALAHAREDQRSVEPPRAEAAFDDRPSSGPTIATERPF